ncbi:MAG: P-II family nitrogen regulator [Gammaproteobacteria bacterium]|nr:P-II family nitrogen regulator [Gammaproteobacteria bacterium]MBU1978427.1 P-II family nitrogen regulator [Gammaproteobacteria bacterium]
MSDEIVVLTDAVLITAIVQRGVADDVVRAARRAGAQGATVFYARGMGVRQRHMGVLGVTVNAEKEVIYIVASTDQADHIFERIFTTAKLDTPGMGMAYVTPLEKMATYIPPELIEKFSDSES